MKKYLFIIITLLTSLVATSCQDEDFGFTEQDVFKGAYKRNFESTYGKIDSNQSWDLSAHGRSINKTQGTRAASDLPTDTENFYRVMAGTITDIKTEVPEGGNNSNKASSFGLLSTGEPFMIVPISQDGKNKSNTDTKTSSRTKVGSHYEETKTEITTVDDNWTLKMVVLEEGKTPVETTLWSKNTPANIQISNSEAVDCSICHGHAMVEGPGDIACEVCSGNGWFAGNGEACPNCHGSKKEKGTCTTCDSDRHITCKTCNGNGYVTKGSIWLILFTLYSYGGCPDCLEPGDYNETVWLIGGNVKNKGNRIQICDQCDENREIDVECSKCHGVGTMIRCEWCNGEGKGITCPNPECHDGKTTEIHWEDIPEPYNSLATNADRFRTHPWGAYTAPAGSIIYFYMEVYQTKKTVVTTNNYSSRNSNNPTSSVTADPVIESGILARKVSSLNSDMAVLNKINSPSNLGSGNSALFIGCESGDESVKDYNDATFMIVSSSLPEVKPYKDKKIEMPSISKRYMVEDMGSKSDWDFNDIVVDVFQTREYSIPLSNGIATGLTSTKITSAIVRELCGSLPIKIQIGNTTFPTTGYIEDPTDIVGTTIKIKGSWPDRVEKPENRIGWEPDFEITGITGWDPATNNIHIWVKKAEGEDEDDVWHATFPANGTAPYIIATDCTVMWKGEGEDIPNSWWKPKTDTWTGK